MERSRAFKNIQLFLPLLALYVIVVLVFSNDTLFGDELRHVGYATNLSNGYYTEAENPELRNGPGYPMILAPFIALNISLFVPKLLNAFVLFLAVIYFKKTLDLFTRKKYAIVFAYVLGLYPPVIRWVPCLYSEPLAFLLVCGLIYHVCTLFKDEKPKLKQFVITSFYLGLLVLVKIIFLQVILVSLVVLGLLFIWKRNSSIKKASFVLLGGFVWILPYLIYTFLLTGKLFYVGTAGGEILYHRSTPYENEWGNWFSREDVLYGSDTEYIPTEVYQDLSKLSENHREVYLKLEPLTYIERDSALKSIAIENMKAHPVKYLKNTVSNVSRLVFNYPFSYRDQNLSTYGYMIPNMILLVLLIIVIYPFYTVRKKVPFELKAILVFSLIYLGGIILLDGRGRNFIVAVPAFILLIAYIFSNVLKVDLMKSDLKESS